MPGNWHVRFWNGGGSSDIPSYRNIYPHELWKQFLAQRGYTQTTAAVFQKGIVSARDF